MTVKNGYGNLPLIVAQYSIQSEYVVPNTKARRVAPRVDAGGLYLFSSMKKSRTSQYAFRIAARSWHTQVSITQLRRSQHT